MTSIGNYYRFKTVVPMMRNTSTLRASLSTIHTAQLIQCTSMEKHFLSCRVFHQLRIWVMLVVYVYIYIYTCTRAHTHTHTFKYIYTYTYTHTHTHTHKGPGSTGAPQGRVRANCEPRTRRRLQCVMGTLVHTSHGSLSSTRRPQTAGMMRRPCLRDKTRFALASATSSQPPPCLPAQTLSWPAQPPQALFAIPQ